MEQRGNQNIQADEKSGLLAKERQIEAPVEPLRKRQYVVRGLVAVLVAFAWLSVVGIENLLSRQPKGSELDKVEGNRKHVDYEDIIPSETLEWHTCYEDFKCARLTVAMDYHRPLNASKDNPKVHIALILIPGTHEKPESYSPSPLLINPGGPGGSGVQTARGLGGYLQAILGEGQDIIGFDPRGIGATTPRTDCFSFPGGPSGEDDYVQGQFHRMLWQTSGREIGLVNSSEVALHKIDARSRGLGKLCGEKDYLNGNDSIFKYVSTPNVARDMVSIVDAWDEWNAALSGPSAPLAEETDETNDFEEVSGLDTKGKLVYWGFSYGTLLGATFAAMFPDHVGRVVLDGVVDADYYVSPIWAESIRDADAIAELFYTYCHEAGNKCDLYKKDDTPADIKTRFEGVLARIRKEPIVLVNDLTKLPQVIYESDIRSLLFSTLYSPTLFSPITATIFDRLDSGDYDALKRLLGGFTPEPDLPSFCNPPPSPQYLTDEANFAIMCSDKRYPLNGTLSELNTTFEKMANTSSFADVWMTLMIGCDGWPVESKDPPMRWDDHPAHNPKPIKTSFPLLFISNTRDPVTPLYAGVKMAQKFVDAGLIEQKSEGHCSLSAVSSCTAKKIVAYFREGKVPPHPVKSDKGLFDGKWDKCEAESWPWHPYDPEMSIADKGEEGKAEVKMMKALEGMQREFAKQVKPWKSTGALSTERLVELSLQQLDK
ncbi:Tripeptidyl aminopeptidase [Lachnellula hyalina]|uniref:Tripeptidyl aminopeptidase n=1 Tax=Lachnellula hyalina TaxID=1316788 RepID=A0A8H8TXQ1_9HELO|nr:Tripeptidyl aminopeptidase [Lachnellula hyalina]TVY25767.1 Tripeptidyl aminopeptidase [Lachnellula hyalina]